MLVLYLIKWDKSHMSILLFLPIFLSAVTMLLHTVGFKVNYSVLKLTGVASMLNVKAPTNTEDYYL